MGQIECRFYAELNDFLPPERRQRAFTCPLERRASVKDVIEALGVPHTEVDLILANGESVDFAYQVRDGDRISVYPVFESIDIGPIERVRPRPLRETRFVLDTHLGKLAAYLRLLGFDALYRSDYDDATLARVSQGERRILLTRDRGLLKRRAVSHGYFVRSDDPERQLAEVVRHFDLAGSIAPLTRCPRCNAPLELVAKAEILDRLLPKTRAHYDEFRRCPSCGQIYWRGSHYTRIERLIAGLNQAPPAP